MSYVATLVTNPTEPVLTAALVERVRDVLPNPARSAWLAPGVAADIFFTPIGAPDPRGYQNAVRHELRAWPVDVIVQPRDRRRKRLFIADMDSTMIGQECIDELADFAGLRERVAAITERAMRGEIAFEPALRERVALLRGLSVETLQLVLRERITMTPGAAALVGAMRSQGAFTALVSGGFTAFTAPVAAKLGFDAHQGNVLEESAGRLTGAVREPILGREAKLAALKAFCAERGLDLTDALAVGDGANDLAMLGEAGLGVAFHAKPAVAAAAHADIRHADLTALLYAQGYRQEEFAAAA